MPQNIYFKEMEKICRGGRFILQNLIKENAKRNNVPGSDHPWSFTTRGYMYKSSDRLMDRPYYAKTGRMECILTTDIAKLGRSGNIVEVAPGFFRNYLLPNHLALPYQPQYELIAKQKMKLRGESLSHFKRVDKSSQKKKKYRSREWRTAARILDKGTLGIRKRLLRQVDQKSTITEDGVATEVTRKPIDTKVLESQLTKDEIVAEVERQLRVIISPKNLVLRSDIRETGDYKIPLQFPPNVLLPQRKPQIFLSVCVRRK